MSRIELSEAARLVFAGGTLDRAAELRDDKLAASMRERVDARMVLVGPAQSVLLDGPERLARLPVTAEPGAGLVLLGREPGGYSLFAADGEDEALGADQALGEGLSFISLRQAAAGLEHAEAALAAYAVGLIGWHRSARFCGRCGTATELDQAGHSRRCPACHERHFPRTDPAVTMVIEAGERCLLTRRHTSVVDTWSALAGFVEPGETPEQAVVREAHEEVGVRVHAVEYVGAQPWPFPRALMLGYRAFAEPTTEPAGVRDATELLDARWFTRSELRAALGDGSARLPPPIAIGHALITAWLERG